MHYKEDFVMSSADRVEIPGSQRELEPQSRIGAADSDRQIEVSVYLRSGDSLDWVDQEAERPPSERRTISREELASSHGASEKDIEAVSSFASNYGLEVVAAQPARRMMVLRGTVAQVTKAFGVQEVGLFQHPSAGAYRGRQGPLTVPVELGGVITGVFGIDERPQARPHVRRHSMATAATSYTPVEVAAAYNFPTTGNGAGETVAILELGGGFSQADLDSYFQGLGITPPSVSAVSVDGGSNSPGTDQNADGEVMLDIEVVGAVAPGAKIVVYFAPNTDQGFIDAVSTAVHDTANGPSVLSISWGGPEDTWTGQARTQMEQAMTEAAALGVTVTVAAGDNGSTDGVNDGKQHVDFPASAPHALACGGTVAGHKRPDHKRDRVERRPQRRRHRRRHQHRVPRAVLPERGLHADQRRHPPTRPRRARRRRQRRPPDWLSDPGRRPTADDRRHQRGGAALGWPHRLDQPVAREARRVPPAAALRRFRAERVPRHHPRQQRRLRHSASVGSLHRQRIANRNSTAASAWRSGPGHSDAVNRCSARSTQDPRAATPAAPKPAPRQEAGRPRASIRVLRLQSRREVRLANRDGTTCVV